MPSTWPPHIFIADQVLYDACRRLETCLLFCIIFVFFIFSKQFGSHTLRSIWKTPQNAIHTHTQTSQHTSRKMIWFWELDFLFLLSDSTWFGCVEKAMTAKWEMTFYIAPLAAMLTIINLLWPCVWISSSPSSAHDDLHLAEWWMDMVERSFVSA